MQNFDCIGLGSRRPRHSGPPASRPSAVQRLLRGDESDDLFTSPQHASPSAYRRTRRDDVKPNAQRRVVQSAAVVYADEPRSSRRRTRASRRTSARAEPSTLLSVENAAAVLFRMNHRDAARLE